MSGVDETEDELQVDADQELLVASLDGELSESESARNRNFASSWKNCAPLGTCSMICRRLRSI
jgi:hypothetical protein